MLPYHDVSAMLKGFSGNVRLFPLPNLVLFPHVIQPLHVFEPRYRALVEDALWDDRLVAIATLASPWDAGQQGRPPLYPVACLAQITAHRLLEDGNHNMLVLGLKRVRLVRELAGGKGFREAKVECCDDLYPAGGAGLRRALHWRLRKTFSQMLTSDTEAQQQLEQILNGDVPLGVLTDVVAHTLQLCERRKRELLEERNVERRAQLLLEALAGASSGTLDGQTDAGWFPPSFSVN